MYYFVNTKISVTWYKKKMPLPINATKLQSPETDTGI